LNDLDPKRRGGGGKHRNVRKVSVGELDRGDGGHWGDRVSTTDEGVSAHDCEMEAQDLQKRGNQRRGGSYRSLKTVKGRVSCRETKREAILDQGRKCSSNLIKKPKREEKSLKKKRRSSRNHRVTMVR